MDKIEARVREILDHKGCQSRGEICREERNMIDFGRECAAEALRGKEDRPAPSVEGLSPEVTEKACLTGCGCQLKPFYHKPTDACHPAPTSPKSQEDE